MCITPLRWVQRFATDACFGVTNDALQLLGGYGCVGPTLSALASVACACTCLLLPPGGRADLPELGGIPVSLPGPPSFPALPAGT